MGQILQNDRVGALSLSGGTDIQMAASSSVPVYLTIGGQQYQVTSNLTRTIATDVPSLAANSIYSIYAVISAGMVVLRISINGTNSGPAGFSSWKLLGSFYTNSSSIFSAMSDLNGWVPGVFYNQGAVVSSFGYDLKCIVAHTSSTSFITDSQSGYWQMAAPLRNYLINGDAYVYQRGSSGNPTPNVATYSAADRWYIYQVGGSLGNVTQSRLGGSGLQGLPIYNRIQRNTGATVNDVRFQQIMESGVSTQLAGKMVTLSFWGRAGANYSPTSSALPFHIQYGTGQDQSASSLASGSWTGQGALSRSITLTTSWQRFSLTTVIPTAATQLAILFGSAFVGTAGADDRYDITGVMLHEGPAPAIYANAGVTQAEELAMCQRYYEIITAGQLWGDGYSNSAGGYVVNASAPFAVVKRVTPTVSVTWNLGTNNTPSSNITPSGVLFSSISNASGTRMILQSVSNLTANAEF